LIFRETPLAGCFVVDIEPIRDERGFFARIACDDELAEHGLSGGFIQTNLTWNEHAATLRGIHFQHPPHAEAKLVRCTRGRLFDVAVDLRDGSTTRFSWFGLELDDRSGRALYIPEGFGHGYVTLQEDTELMYQSTARYHGASASGVRWDDPALAIDWPVTPRVVSPADRSWGLIEPASFKL
jgi:dTDP-4-dehydrorhamnose 3,5-epimerase